MIFETNNENEPYIRSLEQLKYWNQNPTKEKPIAMEWFYDGIFDDVLSQDEPGFLHKCRGVDKRYELFVECLEQFILMTCICELMSENEATILTLQNLNYWKSRASKSEEPFNTYIEKWKQDK